MNDTQIAAQAIWHCLAAHTLKREPLSIADLERITETKSDVWRAGLELLVEKKLILTVTDGKYTLGPGQMKSYEETFEKR